ncbi:MAG: hypothetical protein IPL32_16020 [Chloracidobacterium sp.]|nr:hypothetical protein [Chloracidobacterium sp.]
MNNHLTDRILTFALVMMAFAISGFSQKVEDGWKGLLPFKSTRADVEKIFGNGKPEPDRWLREVWQYKYDSAEAVIGVVYSGAPCDKKTPFVNRYDLPANTILRYRVQLKQPVPITELRFDADRFDQRDPFKYEDVEFIYWKSSTFYDLHLEGFISAGRDYIKYIDYGTPFKEAEKRRCTKTVD